MDQSTPQSILKPGQRTLAAIVFTDVVGFSARMQADEVSTLRLLQRDFAAVRALCGKHQGSVLKTTGDGLLLYFSSAVQAVACALAMQRHFAGVSRKGPTEETLVHRVGIHLGDVFVSEEDVMGDGVNIAARLQAEAEPGGICISQTVYDVVKNKLELHVTSLGARELKNIAESIPIYRLLLDAEEWQEYQRTQSTAPMVPPPAAAASPGDAARPVWWRQPSFLRIAVGILVLALVFSVLALLRLRARAQRQKNELAAARAAITLALDEPAANGRGDVDEYARALNDNVQSAIVARNQFLERYDFAGLAQYLRQNPGGAGSPAYPMLRKSVEQMAQMQAWVNRELQNYSQQHPLRARELTGTAPKELQVFAKPDGLLYFVEGGAVRGRAWSEVKPVWIGAVITGALLEARMPPGREIVQGVTAFARIYNQPEMVETLRVRRPHKAGLK
ncbi:MAG: adenylate/guanylate cyclase domain-containing protein [Opitutae bacterium]|nr:adenylate/guanylate cyclase domain-containing protein [Opitutae bacterium]